MAFPTETVYGLGADARNPRALLKIFQAKGRPSTNPLIVHVADEQIAQRYAAEWPEAAAKLAEHFWPGPLTLVVPKSKQIAAEATAGLQTVGLRVPRHPVALELLSAFDGPVAAPSANRSTRVSPTTAQHVRDELGNSVDMILDGGACEVGIESTVVSVLQEPPAILRLGGLSREDVEQVIGRVGIQTGAVQEGARAVSPGQQSIHYAPKAPAFRFESTIFPRIIRELSGHADAVCAVLHLSPLPEDQAPPPPHHFIHMPLDSKAYAKRLYASLREVDVRGIAGIYVEMPPAEPAWEAVRDRITRATKQTQ